MKKITLISHYLGLRLSLRVSDKTYEILRQAKDPMEKINYDRERIIYGYEPQLLSKWQHRKIATFFVKDSIEYFELVDF